MYREPPPLAETEAERRELAYRPRDAEYGVGAMPGLVPIFIGGGGVVAGALVAIHSPTWGGIVMLASIALGILAFIWLRRGRRIVFTVTRGEIVVLDGAFVRTRIAIHRLENVIVDGDLHHACITLVPEEPQQRIELTNKSIARDDCVEWAAKIRAFLRANGWTPLDERPPISST